MKARRVVTMVESHFGELFPRAGFIVTGSSVHCRSAGKSKWKVQIMPILAHRRGPPRVDRIRSVGHPSWSPQPGKGKCMQSKREPSHMAGQIKKVATNQVLEAELRIEEITASSGTVVRLQGVSVATAPHTGEKID